MAITDNTGLPAIVGGDTGFDMSPQDDDAFDMFGAGIPTVVPDEVADHRAEKYDYALGDTSPGKDQLKHQMITGGEDVEREHQRSLRAIDDQQNRLQLFKQYIAEAGPNADRDFAREIMTAPSEELANPYTLYEKLYARKFMADLAVSDAEATDVDGTVIQSSTYADAMEEDPEATQSIMDAAERVKANQEYFLKTSQDLNARWDQAGLGSTIANYAEMLLIPGRSWYNQQNAVEGAPGSSFLLGNNKEEQYAYLLSLPYEEMVEKLNLAVGEMEARNPLDAMEFVSGLVSFTGTDKFLSNAVAVSDLTLPLPVVGVVPATAYKASAKAVGGAVGRFASMAKGGLKASSGAVTKPVEVIAATGNIAKAAGMQAGIELGIRVANAGSHQSFADFSRNATSLMDPSSIAKDIGNLPREQAQRLVEIAEGSKENLLSAVFETNIQMTRLTADEETEALGSLRALLNKQYGHGSSVVIDIAPVANADAVLGNASMARITMGKVREGGDPNAALAAGLNKLRAERAALSKAANEAQDAGEIAKRDKLFEQVDAKDAEIKSTEGRLKVADVKAQAKITIGTKDAELFDTAEAALRANEIYGIYKPDVVEIGGKYALQYKAPLPETGIFNKDSKRLTTQNVKTPESIATGLLGSLRSSKDRVSKDMGARMDMALMGGQQLKHIADQELAPVGRLSTKEYDDLDRYMNWERFAEGAGDVRGRFASTIGEFEKNYMNIHKELPSYKQQEAYWALRRINDLGYAVTNVGLLTDKSRLGLQLFDFGKTSGVRPSIEGKLSSLDELFKGDNNVAITIIDDVNVEDSKTYWKNYLGRVTNEETGERAPTAAEIKALVDSGDYKIVQVSRTGRRRLQELYTKLADEASLDFVLTKKMTSSPLDLEQLPYRAGWHSEMDDGVFISQANIRRSKRRETPVTVYHGDTNAYHFVETKMAEKFLPSWEKARQLLKERKINELKIFLNGPQGLGMKPKTFIKMFRTKNNPDAPFDVNEPFRLRYKNQSLEKQYKLSAENPNWIDASDNPYDLYRGGINLQWAGERQDMMYTAVQTGDNAAPAWKYKPARYIDAMDTTVRAAKTTMRNVYMNDFKKVAGERMVAEFGSLLDNSADELRANPFLAIVDPKWKTDVPAELKGKLAAAKANRAAYAEFLGIRSENTMAQDNIRAKLWQSLLAKKGEDGAYATIGTIDWLDGYMFGAISDPVKFAKGFAFHQKMGFFNPVHLLLGAQTMAHVVGVAGLKNGAKGFEAAMLQRAAMLNPKHLGFLAKKGAYGWTKEDLQESFDWAQRSGWYRVGKEISVLDDYIEPEMVSPGAMGAIKNAGDKMLWFFKEGDRITRMTAWNASYSEWRAANPGKAMTGADATAVLGRADLLSNNMTAASNAAWQKGVLSIPSQFWSYQVRLMEQFMGKRLTGKEKVRAMMTYSIIYGAPVATGAAVGFWPVHETVREYALMNGWDENAAYKALDGGLMNAATEFLTGEELGTSERLGPGGLPFIEDVWDGDTTIGEALVGVAGSTAAENFKAMYPFAYSLYAMFNPDLEYKLTADDFYGLARTINTGNSIYNIMAAYNLVQAASKNGIPTDKLEGHEAWMAALGLGQPRRISDAYRILENEKERKNFAEEGIKQVALELRRGIDPKLSPEDRLEHQKRATHLMHHVYNLSPENQRKALKQGTDKRSNVETIVRKAAEEVPAYREFWKKNAEKLR
jgi:hypothetical protein